MRYEQQTDVFSLFFKLFSSMVGKNPSLELVVESSMLPVHDEVYLPNKTFAMFYLYNTNNRLPVCLPSWILNTINRPEA